MVPQWTCSSCRVPGNHIDNLLFINKIFKCYKLLFYIKALLIYIYYKLYYVQNVHFGLDHHFSWSHFSRHFFSRIWRHISRVPDLVLTLNGSLLKDFLVSLVWFNFNSESLWLPAIYVHGGIQSGLTDVREQWVWCFLSVWHPGIIPVYQKNPCTLLFSDLRSP